ncbi:hypothetical protein OGAPHI_005575 [Ogataea philodendri]|uniref:Uncharacterized protein n=1 Tax=Ogataea philodendri TaxID=1378263 RepID=A0A9P8P0B2_9ASCO|nr:uncharacterized protein OGAPHI_005575 [Ogataea philodendri]KAH3662324.1 hypothetical protein OGAPHI_005575 [Ogataea philodendri]
MNKESDGLATAATNVPSDRLLATMLSKRATSDSNGGTSPIFHLLTRSPSNSAPSSPWFTVEYLYGEPPDLRWSLNSLLNINNGPSFMDPMPWICGTCDISPSFLRSQMANEPSSLAEAKKWGLNGSTFT